MHPLTTPHSVASHLQSLLTTKTHAAMLFLHHESHEGWKTCLRNELPQLDLVASEDRQLQWHLQLDPLQQTTSLPERLWHRLLALVDRQHPEETLHREDEVALAENLSHVEEVALVRRCVVAEVEVQGLDLEEEAVM